MQLLAPDILADARGLSTSLCVAGLIVGVALWLLGWWSHRFWMVLLTTVLAGIYGLYQAPTLGAQPVVAALLMAVAAGMLALALVHMVAFVSGGVAFLALVQALVPASTEHALILFLLGGLLGLFLYRLWMMALSSLGGALLAGYSGLCLADGLGKIDAVEWSAGHPILLNWLCAAATLMGVAIQFYLYRRRSAAKATQPKNDAKPAEPPKPKQEAPPPKRTLWSWGEELFRQAG